MIARNVGTVLKHKEIDPDGLQAVLLSISN